MELLEETFPKVFKEISIKIIHKKVVKPIIMRP